MANKSNTAPSQRKYVVLLALQALVLAYVLFTAGRTYGYIEEERRLEAQTIKYERFTESQKDILVLGDSLAYGIGTSTPETSFAGQLGQHFPDYNIINEAVIGDETENLATAIDDKIQREYDLVFVIIGGNDILRYGVDIEESAQHLNTITGKAAKHAEQAYIITTSDFKNVSFVPWFARPYFSKRSNTLRQAGIAAASLHSNVTYLDAFDFDPEEYKNLEATDGFHLNDAGMARLVEMIVQRHTWALSTDR